MRRLIWTAPSRIDLRDIRDFYLDRNAGAGARILRAIREKATVLEGFPAAGPVLDGDVRVLSIGNTPYAIQYRIVGDVIQILRIRHEREDWR
jgi:toxin ParE1/3/4